jgi:uncharacterized protein
VSTSATIPKLIRNAHGERIAFSFVAGEPESRELIVIGHGVTSDKERPWSEGLSTRLAESGVASLRIAWSGNGDSEGSFADSTVTKEVADLGAVLDALDPAWRVSFVGHSMGATVGVLTAAGDRRIHRLVSLAGLVHTKEFMERYFGHLSVGDFMLGKPHCPLSNQLVEDLHSIETVVHKAQEIHVPWLIVHGTSDTVIPIGHSRDMMTVAESAELVELPNVDHSFTGKGLAQLANAVVPWLLRPN